jgi:hypothetical protein
MSALLRFVTMHSPLARPGLKRELWSRARWLHTRDIHWYHDNRPPPQAVALLRFPFRLSQALFQFSGVFDAELVQFGAQYITAAGTETLGIDGLSEPIQVRVAKSVRLHNLQEPPGSIHQTKRTIICWLAV